jgi:hypothetical protein
VILDAIWKNSFGDQENVRSNIDEHPNEPASQANAACDFHRVLVDLSNCLGAATAGEPVAVATAGLLQYA